MSYRSVPEETLYINLPDTDGLKLKAILRGSFDQPLVVMVHGRPGEGNELLQYLGARYLYEQGFASLRLFMYDFSPDTRDLLDCTLDTHAADFTAVIEYIRDRGAKTVFGVGHSYGGLTILKSDAKLDGAVLWDPTHGSVWQDAELDLDFSEEVVGDMTIVRGGYGYIVPTAQREYDKRLGDTSAWAAHKGYPIEVISAGQGSMTHLGKRYVESADEPKRQVVIADAHHQFEDSDEVVIRLFQETASWLKGNMHD